MLLWISTPSPTPNTAISLIPLHLWHRGHFQSHVSSSRVQTIPLAWRTHELHWTWNGFNCFWKSCYIEYYMTFFVCWACYPKNKYTAGYLGYSRVFSWMPRTSLRGKNEQGLKYTRKTEKTTQKRFVESTQDSKHEEVYMTSKKMSSAGNDQHQYFKSQSCYMPTPMSLWDHLTPLTPCGAPPRGFQLHCLKGLN